LEDLGLVQFVNLQAWPACAYAESVREVET
jgi:hypothetical protein